MRQRSSTSTGTNDPLAGARSLLRLHAPGIRNLAFRAAWPFLHSEWRILSGNSPSGKIRVLMACPEHNVPYYSRLFFGGNRTAQISGGRVQNSGIGRLLQTADADVALAHTAMPLPADLVLPGAVGFSLRTGNRFEDFLPSLGKSAAREARTAAATTTPHISTEAGDFESFYDGYYVPTALARHGDGAVLTERGEASLLFHRGFILFVESAGRRIGALLAFRRGKTLFGKLWGVPGGSDGSARSAANSAMMYHLLHHAFSEGCSAVDLGYSQPFGSDGTHFFKSKWGAKPYVPDTGSYVCIRFRDASLREAFRARAKPVTLDSLSRS